VKKYQSLLVIGANSELILPLLEEAFEHKIEMHLTYHDSKSYIQKFTSEKREKENVFLYKLDLTDKDSVDKFCLNDNIYPDLLILSAGLTDDSLNLDERTESSKISKIFLVNLLSPSQIINSFVEKYFEREDLNLDVVCLSSIAGIRGRKRNMYYSAAKAGLNSFLSSLRQKCHNKKIRIFTVLPGYVDTRMTSNLSLPKFLVVSPKKICNKIVRSLKRNQQIIYPNFIWKIISLTLRLIPEKVFKTLKF
jgi:hypothetical protein